MVSSPTSPVTPERDQPYVAYRRQQEAKKRARLKQRHLDGLKTAKELADLLKLNFSVTKVVLFGSMLSVNDIRMTSDIDLAVWDLPSTDYIRALTELMSQSGTFSVDLVRIEEAPPSLKAYVEKKG